MRYLLFLALFLAGSAFTGCPTGKDAADIPLPGTTWTLTEYTYEGSKQAPVTGRAATIRFTADQVNGNTGCNNYFGGYAAQGSTISFTGVGMTKIYCTESAEQEQAFTAILNGAKTYSASAGSLRIEGPAGTLVFVANDASTAAEAEGEEDESPEAVSSRSAAPAGWQIEDVQPVLIGEFAYMADAAIFFDCESGQRYPVAMRGNFPVLEAAYRMAMGDAAGQRAYTVLVGSIKEGNKPDGRGTTATIFVDEVVSVSGNAKCNTPIERMAGMYRYLADASLFTACQTGKKSPVAMAAANIAMERGYGEALRRAGRDGGEPVYVEIEGFYGDAPKMEGDGAETALYVTRVIGFDAGAACR